MSTDQLTKALGGFTKSIQNHTQDITSTASAALGSLEASIKSTSWTSSDPSIEANSAANDDVKRAESKEKQPVNKAEESNRYTAELRKAVDLAATKLRETEVLLDKCRIDLSGKEDECERVTAEVKTVKEQLSIAYRTITELQTRAESMSSVAEVALQSEESLKVELQRKTQQISVLESSANDVQRQLAEACKRWDNLNVKYQDLLLKQNQSSNGKSEETFEDLERRMDALLSNCDKLEHENEMLRGQVSLAEAGAVRSIKYLPVNVDSDDDDDGQQSQSAVARRIPLGNAARGTDKRLRGFTRILLKSRPCRLFFFIQLAAVYFAFVRLWMYGSIGMPIECDPPEPKR